MTNAEITIKAIEQNFDDWGFSDGWIERHLACPYNYGDERCKCRDEAINYDTCVECKTEWLEAEADD